MSVYWDSPDGTRYYPGDNVPGMGVWVDRTMADEYPHREGFSGPDTGSGNWDRWGLGGAFAWARAKAGWSKQQAVYRDIIAGSKYIGYGQRVAAGRNRQLDRRLARQKWRWQVKKAPYYHDYGPRLGRQNMRRYYARGTGRHRKPYSYARHSLIGTYNKWNYLY